MRIIPEDQAPQETKKLYNDLKGAFQLHTLPLFFAYIGAYPEYLAYITEQIVQNINNSLFKNLTHLLESEVQDMTDHIFQPTYLTREWLSTYKQTPTFYNFQQDLQKNYQTNIQLALVFIALREAVKGWAVAAKKLTSENNSPNYTPTETTDFIFTQDMPAIPSKTSSDQGLETQSTELTVQNATSMERDLLGPYLQLCKHDFEQIIKTEQFLYTRVQLEKTLLTSIHTFPHLVSSPINVVLELTKKYPDFSELLYLISEHFPIYTVQRLMFSGYMLKNLS